MARSPLRSPRCSAWPLALLSLFALGCGKKRSTEISLADPRGLRTDPTAGAAYAEFDVFPDGCPSAETLAKGSFTNTLVNDVVAVDAPFPDVGDLPAGSYGFAALLRTADCKIIGFGCTPADLNKVRSVNIRVDAITDGTGNIVPQPSCSDAQSCNMGRCDSGAGGGPVDGGGGGSGGADVGAGGAGGGGSGAAGAPACPTPNPTTGCTFQLVASGALPPVTPGTTITGPGAVSLGKGGFVLALREFDPQAGASRIALLPVTKDGCPGQPVYFSFPPECMLAPDPGFGMAWNDDTQTGLIAVARTPSCAVSGGGMALLLFDENGQVLGSSVLDRADMPQSGGISLSAQHAVARSFAPEEFRVIYSQKSLVSNFATNSTPNGAGRDPGVLSGSAAVLFGADGSTNDMGGVAATSSTLLAEAAAVTVDGGASTGVKISPPGAAALPEAFVALPSPLAAAAFQDKLVLAGQAPTGAISWAAFDKTGAVVSPPATLPVMPAAPLGFDVTWTSDKLVFFTAQALGFTIQPFTTAPKLSAMPDPAVKVDSKMIPALSTFLEGKQIAAAAGNGRVVLSWVSHQTASTDPSGGFAIFGCQ